VTDANLQSLIADRRRQWAEMPPVQQMQRVQIALLDFQDYAIWRRQQARRRTQQRLAAQPRKEQEYARL
jgi:hypothetical protein